MNRPTKPPTRQLLAATDAEFFGATTRHHPASGAAPTYGSTGAVGGGRR